MKSKPLNEYSLEELEKAGLLAPGHVTPLPEKTDKQERIPEAISSSIIRPKKGLEIKIYHLDNGQSVVATDDMDKFVKALLRGELTQEQIKAVGDSVTMLIKPKKYGTK